MFSHDNRQDLRGVLTDDDKSKETKVNIFSKKKDAKYGIEEE